MDKNKIRKRILLLIIVVVGLVHFRCLLLGFNPFWDVIYVFDNPFQKPLSLHLIGQAFTSFLEGNYHPLTLISHSLDYTVWGLRPLGHHLSSYLIHLVNALLVFFIAERLISGVKNQIGRQGLYVAGLTALLFGIHPLRVESVAWVTERKDVLFACFYLLALLTYLKWRDVERSKWYLLSLLFFVLSVLSKSMAVSLPAVLLGLDYWFNSRRKKISLKNSLANVAPFAFIAMAVALTAIQGPRLHHLMAPLNLTDLFQNLIEFPLVPVFYVCKTLWPFDLSPFYPVELTGNALLILSSWVVFVGTLLVVVIAGTRYPLLLAGTVIYVVLLLPIGGIIRAGVQVLAERYSLITTLPILLGLSYLLIKGIGLPSLRKPLIILVSLWLVFLSWKTVTYTGIWDNAIELTLQAYNSYPQSRVARIFMCRSYNNVAIGLIREGKLEEAIQCWQKALEICPDDPLIHRNIGLTYVRQGRLDKAREHYLKAQDLGHRVNPELRQALDF